MQDKEANIIYPQLTPVDEYLLMELFNERKKEYPTNLTIHELFENQVESNPESIAIVYLDQEITYQELNDAANQLAHYLIELGVKQESFVGISVDRSLEMIIAVIAVLKAGAAYIPIETSFPQDLVEFMIDDSSPVVIITSSDYAEKFEATQILSVIKIDDDLETIMKYSTSKPKVDVTESNLAYAIYTSGSTGKRKAALIEHKSIVNQYFAWKDAYQLTDQDSILQTASFSFDVFTGDWVRALCSGSKLVLNPYNLILSPDDSKTGKELYELMKNNNVTCAEFTPPVFRKLLRYAKSTREALDFMRILIVGADAWYMSEHRQLIEFTEGQVRIVNSYGMTEATVDSTYYEEYEAEADDGLSLIGKPFTNTEVYILDDDNNVLPVGGTGELCVAGPGLARGYLNRPELNAERFIEVTFPDGSIKRIYKSGDLARFRHDGNLEFQGRKDNQVELGAIRVELGEIEATIQNHPAIQENSVVVIEDANHNKKAICFIVTSQGQNIEQRELQEFLVDKLPDYMIPSEVYVIDSMPLSQSGKIDRKALIAITQE